MGNARRENRLVRWSNLQCGTCSRCHLTKVPMGQFKESDFSFHVFDAPEALSCASPPHRLTTFNPLFSPPPTPFFHTGHGCHYITYTNTSFFAPNTFLGFHHGSSNTHQNYSSIQYPFHTRRPPYKDSPSSRSDQRFLFPFFVPPKDSVLVLLNYSGNTSLSPIILDVKSRLVRDCERQAVVRTHRKISS